MASPSLVFAAAVLAVFVSAFMPKHAYGIILLPNKYIKECDFYQGSWFYDYSYPLYNSAECPFIEKAFDCQKNGRPDENYLKFKWKPMHCHLPRFDAVKFLTKYEGKSIMFVGDSLSLNQWQSLTCMLHTALPMAAYTVERSGADSIFTFPISNTKIIYSRNALLVDVTRDRANERILLLDSISSSAKWEGMDVLIFDTWHWWFHTGRKQMWDIVGNAAFEESNRVALYTKALKTWARWVDTRVNTTKTKIFFQGVSPDHGNCKNQKWPSQDSGAVHPGEVVLEEVLHNMSKQVYLLNITGLSYQRADGHPSVYGLGGHRGLDCTHWCLPGVPDSWNQLLFAALFSH